MLDITQNLNRLNYVYCSDICICEKFHESPLGSIFLIAVIIIESDHHLLVNCNKAVLFI